MKNPWVIIGLIVVVLVGGSIWFSSQTNETANEGVVIKDHVDGNPDAKVTLTEYSDFQCPACGQFYPYVKEILAEYGDQVRFEYKHFPLIQIHPHAEPAARAAEAAGQQGKFFEYADLLFTNQATWTKGGNPAGYFTQYAEKLGLDMNLFAKQQRSSLIKDKIRAEFDEARGLGLTGTPSFFLNGQRMEIKSYDEFKQQIEAAIGISPVNSEATTSADAATSTVSVPPAPATPTVQFGI